MLLRTCVLNGEKRLLEFLSDSSDCNRLSYHKKKVSWVDLVEIIFFVHFSYSDYKSRIQGVVHKVKQELDVIYLNVALCLNFLHCPCHLLHIMLL